MAEVVVVPHTHWDREWYRTFQGFRLRLVEAVDRILGLLESGRLPYFLLDGQTVMLDDHLEIRPQDESRLENLVRDGRLGIGPWYILPDEFLVSGESIVRNLLFGRERMRRFGAGDAVGYLPDMFGHTAQMPQILRGFGMRSAVVWRGVEPPAEHFWWEDPSGKGLATVYLPTGYCNVHFWSPMDDAARQARHDEFLGEHKLAGPHLLLSGCDHLAPNADLPDIVRRFGAKLGCIADALPDPDRRDLPVVHGELRATGKPLQYLLPDVASARTWIKQANAEVQDLWERLVEPLMAMQVAAGRDADLGFWKEGWELILKNQPHDSICGCSTDAVHREMVARFSQARELGADLVARALDSFAQVAGAPGVTIFNPSGWGRSGWIEVVCQAPAGAAWPEAHLEGLPCFFLGAEDTREFFADIDYHPDWKEIRRYRLLAYVDGLGPFGIVQYPLAEGPGSPAGAPGEVAVAENAIENAHLRVEVSDGSLKLVIKDTGETLTEFLRFVDGGDAGDEYTYSPPEDDRLKMSSCRDYRIVEATPVRATLEVEHGLNIPAALNPDRKHRSMLAVNTAIKTRITVTAGSRMVQCESSLENWALDHRLRALVATGIPRPLQIASEAAFAFVDRKPGTGLGALPVAPRHESVPPTFPHLGVVAVEGDRHAMQIVAPGLPEAEVVMGGQAVAITLLRCVGWLSRDDLRTRGGGAGPQMETPEAQCQGEHSFRFAVRFASPGLETRRAWWDALPDLDHARHPVCVRPTGGHYGPLARGMTLPATWLRNPPAAAVISAVKPACDGRGIVIRAFNPTGEPRAFPLQGAEAWTCTPCNMAEDALGPGGASCEVILDPGVIATYRLTPPRV
jgi:alpha-mannosidase/mannosylglycerate hydrolase